MMLIPLLLSAFLLQDSLDAKVAALRPRLVAEDIETRAAATEELRKLALAAPAEARKVLRARGDAETDATAKAALLGALEAIPPLELKLSVDRPVKVGEQVAPTAKLVNASDREVLVVAALDASDVGWRYPKMTVTITDPDGKSFAPPVGGRCGNTNALQETDFKPLSPGSEFEPLGKGSFGHHPLSVWRPDRPGTWKLKLVVDYSAGDVDEWNGKWGRAPGGPSAEIKALFARVPKFAFSAEAEFKVEAAK